MACQLVEQFILPGGEIALIEVIADDERLKRHTLKLCVDCAVRANFSESDGQCRHAVEPVEHMGGSFHLLGSENKLLLAVPTSPAVIAVVVQDFQPCPAAEAIGFDFGCGEALRQQGENLPKVLVGQNFPSCGKFEVDVDNVLLHRKAGIVPAKVRKPLLCVKDIKSRMNEKEQSLQSTALEKPRTGLLQ